MGTNKEMTWLKHIAAFILTLLPAQMLLAQNIGAIEFCDKQYEYGTGKDSITLFLKIKDRDGDRSKEVSVADLEDHLDIYEDGQIVSPSRRTIEALNAGQRIPADYTFSVLIDLSIPAEGKSMIYDAVGQLVESAPDSCVYISFFGDKVSASKMVNRKSYGELKPLFQAEAANKYFYGALYLKLTEFTAEKGDYEDLVTEVETGYAKNSDIIERASRNRDKNILFVFTEGSRRPEIEELDFPRVTDYQGEPSHLVPKVYALYYTGNGFEENVELTLEGVTIPRTSDGSILAERKGAYMPSDNLDSVLDNFAEVVENTKYDFAYAYKCTEGKNYQGRVSYQAKWKGDEMGACDYSIGTAENPWPMRDETSADVIIKYLMALLVTFLTMAFFFFVVKVLIPFIKSKIFSARYYKRYQPEANVQRRVCTYCRQDIQPGQMVVMKCKHIMHVHCWQQNGYKCAEYGQNCKEGIQNHVDTSDLFSMASIRDCYQTFAGIVAGLLSWIVYEWMGRGAFSALAKEIVQTFFVNEEQKYNLFDTCVTKVSAFLTIGLLLGFFLSLIFRYNDEYRRKDAKIWMKIIGLSVLTGIIGMVSFGVGANIFCMILSAVDTTYIPWFCSLPAYLLFSICTSLSLTFKSSIPMKSAMIGGLCSAVIGFLVLYFSSIASYGWSWMNMLLDFIIYGGGLGASLATVRMLAEKYFLVITNGVKAGLRIPIHKWMNATGGSNKVSIGMTRECEIQMNWEKSNKVAKEHVQLFVDRNRSLPVVKPLAIGVVFNNRAELPVGKASVLSNGDTFKIGDTIFRYEEND